MIGKGASPGHRSGEIARRSGVSTDTLRHYERKGLLAKPRRLGNGLTRFREDLERLLEEWDARLAKTGEAPARLLESLAAGPEIRSFTLRAVAFDRRGKQKEQK